MLPLQLAGWRGREVPLGPNEAVDGAVGKVLRFDDVYFHEFNSARGSISLYVAYWNPGTMPVQLVASHTPDRCWVENGWKNESVQHEAALPGGGLLRAGEWRTFLAPDQQRLHVQFWHLVGSRTYDFGDRVNRVPSAWRWWRDAAQQVFQSPQEQYFIRLTSTCPFAELAGDLGWGELLRALAALGLAQETPLSAKP